MGGETTTYRVEAVYDVTDKASKQLADIAQHAKAAAHHSETLKTVLLGLGSAAIGSRVVHEAKHAFIDFNKEVQNAKISLSTMIQGNYNASFEQASNAANKLYTEFQKFSMQTPVTTQEMLEFSRGVAVATAQAGGSIRDIANMTERGVVAAKALGAESGYASQEIAHMLAGVVNRRMIFAQQILGMAHMSEEEFKKLSAEKRLKTVQGVLGSDSMKEAARQFGESYAGVTSTLEDKLQITLGKVGLPLFKAITEEVKHWNEWLDRNEAQVEYWAKKVGESLVTGFGYAKDAVMFMVDHSGILIKIAEAWAAVKIAGMIGGGIGASVAGAAKQFTGMGGAVKAVGSHAPLIGEALVGGYLAGGYIFKDLNKQIHEYLQPEAAALERVTKRLDEFDLAVAKSRDAMRAAFGDKDARGSDRYAAIRASNERQSGKSQLLYEMAKEMQENPEFAQTSFFKDTYKRKLQDAGFSDTDTRDALGRSGFQNQLAAQSIGIDIANLSQTTNQGVAFSNMMMNAALATLSEDQKQHLDTAKVTNMLLEEYLKGNFMSLSAITKELLGDPFGGLKSSAKVNQHIAITIQQVSAKDPDRWIADMEDRVARRVRAPTRAKNGLGRGF